jgi:hypothetical protein
VLAEQDKQYAYRVTKASLTYHEAWMYYTSCYQKYVGHALVQMLLPKHTLDKLEQKVLRAFTSKCGYNRNMAYAIRDGPSHLGDCEFTPLYHMQGTSQIQNLLRHYRTQLDTKKLLQIALAWAQHQSGMAESILWDTTTPLPHLKAR